MSLAILGLGTALPEAIVTQDEAMRVARILCCRAPDHESRLALMYRHSGIATRHVALGRELVLDILNGTRHSESVFLPKDIPDDPGPTTAQRMRIYAQESVPLAVRASQRALATSGIDCDEITHVVTVSCTGFFSPGIDYALIQQLHLRATVERTHVGYMGCHGAINGLRVANAYAAADPAAKILLCAVELSSLHMQYGWDPQKVIANAIFGDGCAALVGKGTGPGATDWSVTATGSCILPNSSDAMTWTIGEHGFEMTLAKSVPGLIAQHLRPWLEGWLGERRLSIKEIGSWAIHPGGPRILSAVEESLGLAPKAASVSREVFSECGNMSSPTVLFILDRLRSRNAPRPAVALAFGPGLVAEAALIV